MIGIIDVGGGMRDIYGAGVFDRCIDEGIKFDAYLGVSAGAANIASFLGNQRGRNYVFFHDYSFRKEYMSIRNFIKHKCFLNLSYIYDDLSNSKGENPLDYAAMSSYSGPLAIVATNAATGVPRYFSMSDMSLDDYTILKATCCLPLVCVPVEIDGEIFFDGGLSDPVPIQKALDFGCDKIVLVLTKPKDVRRAAEDDDMSVKLIARKYPRAAKSLHDRAEIYNSAVDWAFELEKEGKLLIVAPDDTCGVNTLKRTPESMHKLYEKGYSDAARIRKFIER